MRRSFALLAAVVAGLLVGVAAPASAYVGGTAAVSVRPAHGGTVTVGGSVTTPTALTPDQVAALPQTTLPLQGAHRAGATVTGAALLSAVAFAGPVFDAGKNGSLRASLTVRGAHGSAVTFAYGELDPGFGDHPALLTVSGHRVDLVVPGDRTRLRSVVGVESVTVADLAASVAAPPAGGVQVTDGRRTVVLSSGLLAFLPSRTVTVTFSAAGVPQTHTESGPSLALVELVAGFVPRAGTLVTAVGSDGYGASVTNAEALVGGRPLVLSLVEDGVALASPRLVVDGDLKGGRYVSGVVNLALTR